MATEAESVITPIETATKAVEDLFQFRDHYFERHGIETASQKTANVQVQRDKTLQVLESLQGRISDKARFLMLQGKARNVMPSYDREAEEDLSKAVKLDPKLVEGWLHLGEMYWKKGEIDSAKNCFLGALNHSKDRLALRNLSMVLRQLGRDSKEKMQLVEESVEKAKEAVEMDISDGTSWYILGNAYWSLFFATNQSAKVLKQCLSAYKQAERDVVTKNNPDLHFNRAQVLNYHEDYPEALKCYSQASALDPTWDEPIANERKLLQYLSQLSDLIKTKGKLKGKKLKSACDSLRDADLGPYRGGSYTSPHGKTIDLEPVTLDSLQPQSNPGKVLLGRVVCSVVKDEPGLFTCCIVDKQTTCYAVTVYNMALGYGMKIGDTLAIPEPYLQVVDINYKDHVFNFRSIRVDSPLVLVVNGRKLGLDRQAPTQLTVTAMSE